MPCDYGQVQTIAVLDERYEELKDATEGTQEAEDRDLCKEAMDAIKKDPSQAANPKYAFLFAAAYMKRPTSKDLKSRPATSSPAAAAPPASWASSPRSPAPEKAVYQKAIELLGRRQESWDIAHQTGKYAPQDSDAG